MKKMPIKVNFALYFHMCSILALDSYQDNSSVKNKADCLSD